MGDGLGESGNVVSGWSLAFNLVIDKYVQSEQELYRTA